MFLLKCIYKLFVFMFFLLYAFVVGLAHVLAKIGSVFYGLFILLLIAMLLFTAFNQEWLGFIYFFCLGFVSFLGVSAIMALGFLSDVIGDKLVEILMS